MQKFSRLKEEQLLIRTFFQKMLTTFSKIVFNVNPSFSLRNSGQFVFLKFEWAYLEQIRSKLGDSCSSGYHYKSFTTFIKNTFSFKAYFMLKYLVQHNHASFDQFYQNGYISCSIYHMKLKLVPKFTRLIVLQLSWRDFGLEMHSRSSKISCKLLFMQTRDSIFKA